MEPVLHGWRAGLFFSLQLICVQGKPFFIIKSEQGNTKWQFYCPRNHIIVKSGGEHVPHTSS